MQLLLCSGQKGTTVAHEHRARCSTESDRQLAGGLAVYGLNVVGNVAADRSQRARGKVVNGRQSEEG